MAAKRFFMKVANMRKEQDFILYPYNGDDKICIQSDGRFAIVSLSTGRGIIDSKNHNYPNSITLTRSNISFEMPENILNDIKEYLKINSGIQKEFGILNIENKEYTG